MPSVPEANLPPPLRAQFRQLEAHRNDLQIAVNLIERSPRLTLRERTLLPPPIGPGDRLLVDFNCRTLRSVPGREEPQERLVTPVEILYPVSLSLPFPGVPPAAGKRMIALRVYTEELDGEWPFNCHIAPPNPVLPYQAGICTGARAQALTRLDLQILTAYDIIRGENCLAAHRDTLNHEAVQVFQRLKTEGKLPLDDRGLFDH